MDNISHISDADLMLRRAHWLKKWTSRANDIKAEEIDLHNRFDHSVRRMVATKRILLFPEMLEDAGYYDPQSMRHLHEGSSHGWRS